MSRTITKQNISRLVACLLSLMLVFSLLPAANAAETSGKCGDNLNWSFADNRLTITGSGKMTDFGSWNLPPWYEFRDQIHYLSLPEGMTTVGYMAFYECSNITSVSLPSSVTDIGGAAFALCERMTLLKLPDGLKTIGASAFEQCDSLKDLRLPASLTAIGSRAFYCCFAVRSVTIPASVTELGDSAFAYCTDMVSARVDAALDVLPPWLFYGCESLVSVTLSEQTKSVDSKTFTRCDQMATVYYPGSAEDAEKLRESIASENETFGEYGSIKDEQPPEAETSYRVSQTESGNNTADETTVTVTDNATISTTVTGAYGQPEDPIAVIIDATVIADAGWAELSAAVDEAIAVLKEKAEFGKEVGAVQINGYVASGEEIPAEILAKIAGTETALDVQTEGGTQFEVDGSVLDPNEEISGTLCLSYTTSSLPAGSYEGLGDPSYKIRFDTSSAVKTELKYRLPYEYARATASIFQIENGAPTLLQSVRVDKDGYAHFYIAQINKDVEYIISVNVPGIDESTLIIPEELYGEYGVTTLAEPVEYVITGGTSSWGMDAGQVSWILFAVLGACVVGIGVFMYAMNKRKLKMGYVPELDDDDEDEE